MSIERILSNRLAAVVSPPAVAEISKMASRIGLHHVDHHQQQGRRQQRQRPMKSKFLLMTISILMVVVMIKQTKLAILTTSTMSTSGVGLGGNSTQTVGIVENAITPSDATNVGDYIDRFSNTSGLEHIPVPKIPYRNKDDDDTTFSACLLVMDDVSGMNVALNLGFTALCMKLTH